jgi:isoquinoline 1-oxidoreductase subunit beta
MADTTAPAPAITPVTGPQVGRRRFLGYLVAGSTLTAVAQFVPVGGGAAAQDVSGPMIPDHYDLTDLLMHSGMPTYYDLLIEITSENRVRFEVPRGEVGQGVVTAAAMMLADELDARLEDIDASCSPAEPRRRMGQLTGGSHSIRSLWDPIRVIASQLRASLAAAGAEALGVDASEVETRDTHVWAADGRSVAYGEISEAASAMGGLGAAALTALGVNPAPKPVDQHRVIGSGRSRLDARAIATGTAVYTQDVLVGEALPTVPALPPTFGARVVSVDDAAARALPGVVDVVEFEGRDTAIGALFVAPGVAVVAETFDIAQRARDLLQIQWSEGIMDHVSDAEISAAMRGTAVPVIPGLPEMPGGGYLPGLGDAPALPAIPGVSETLEWEFEFPYVPHAPLETMGAVADVRGDSAEVWMGAKMPIISLQQIAEAVGLDEDDVTLHVMPAGGSFGRRLYWEAGLQAAQISQAVGRPVKLMYTRTDDMNYGRCRPASVNLVRAVVSGSSVMGFQHHMVSPEMDLRHGFGEAISAQGGDYNNQGYGQTIFHLTCKTPYKFGVKVPSLYEFRLEVPTAPYRVVYNGQYSTVNELVLRELAEHFGEDEVELRRRLIDNDRGLAVLNTLAEVGQWGRTLPDGVAQGIGMHDEYKSRVGYLAEIDVRGERPRVSKMVCVVDVGRVINTTGTTSMMLGCAIEGVTLALRGALHIDNGAIRENSYADYHWARMDEAPFDMEVVIMPDNEELPGGTGELGVPAATAAVANAYARATGTSPRRFPILEHEGS